MLHVSLNLDELTAMKNYDFGKMKTRQELASELGISRKTFYRKLKSLEIDLPPGLIPPVLQKKISEKIGVIIPEHSRSI